MGSYLTDEAKSVVQILLGIDTENEYDSALTDEAKEVCRKLLELEEDNSYDSTFSEGVADYIKELLGIEGEEEEDGWKIKVKLISTENYLGNQYVDSVTFSGDTITITANANLLPLDSDTNNKYVWLEIDMGIVPITDVIFDGEQIIEDEIEYSKDMGCADDGYVYWVPFDLLLEEDITITLEANNIPQKTITIKGIDSSNNS